MRIATSLSLFAAVALTSLFASAAEPATPPLPAPATHAEQVASPTAEAAPAAVIPANDTSRIGTFKHVEGEVWLARSAQRLQPAAGDGVKEAERLQTGAAGAASIQLKDGTVLTMGPNTTMDLSRFNFDSTTQQGHFVLDLLQGSVRVITGLLARINPELFKVQTPTSVVGVRGTDFIVHAEAPR